MPINNSYSQTPKRIFTNKPFIKGMTYTNADLDPYVCRAMANLELESSNSATKTRLGAVNEIIGNAGETAYAFYNKYVLFSNFVLENDYDVTGVVKANNSLGIRVLDKELKEHEFCDTIITNNSELEIYNGRLSVSGGEAGMALSGKTIYALKMNEGDIPHCINNEDFSFLFFGIIASGSTQVYKGMIKLYYHVAANKIVIETITPSIVDNVDVTDTGMNILSDNPSIYKDYLTYPEHDFYRDYMGDIVEDSDKKVIDILTIAMYDNAVASNPYSVTTNANVLKGIDKTRTDNVYIRPYVAMPNGTNYGAIITATNSYGTLLYYNFNSNQFESTSVSTVTTNINTDIPIPTYITSTYTNTVSLNVDPQTSTPTMSSISVPAMYLVAKKATTSRLLSDNNNYADVFNINKTEATLYKQYSSSATYNTPANPSTQSITFNGTKIDYSFYEIINNRSSRTYVTDTQRYLSRLQEDYTRPYICMVAESLNSNNYADNGIYVRCPIIAKLYDPLGNSTISISDISNIYFSNDIECTITANGVTYIFALEPDTYETSFNSPSISYLNDDHHYCNINFGDITIKMKPISVYDGSTLQTSNVNGMFKAALSTLSDLGTPVANIGQGGYYRPDAHTWSSIGFTIDTRRYNITFSGGSNSNAIFNYTVRLNQTNTQGFIDAPASTVVNNVLTLNLENTLLVTSDAQIKTDVSYTVLDNNISNLSTYIKVQSNLFYYDDISTDISLENAIAIAKYGYVENTSTNISVSTTQTRQGVYETYVRRLYNTISTKNLNIPVKQSAFSDINGSTIKVKLFPITGSTSSGTPPETYFFENTSAVEQTLYTIRTDKFDAIDHTEISYNNNIKTTPTRVCNHLGHIVLWGDNTGSNSLYYSEHNNPSYFPSNYVFTFDNPIVYAYSHNGNLIVFTTDDIYMLHSGNVPSTKDTTGKEVAFTQTLIQSNTRLGKDNIHTVRSIGKDVFFINNNNNGYLLKANKYVSNVSDVYLVRITNQINDLLDDPFAYANERYNKWIPNTTDTEQSLSPSYIHFIGGVSTTGFTAINDFSNMQVTDGDTISYNNIDYRLADINTPEVVHPYNSSNDNDYLGTTSTEFLKYMLSQCTAVYIKDTNDTDKYGRHIAYINMIINNSLVSVNATMLYNGLATFFDEVHDTILVKLSKKCAALAVQLKNGLHNNYKYKELLSSDFNVTREYQVAYIGAVYNLSLKDSWDYNSFKLYTYATNSYIYIFQAIKLSLGKSITIIYKYNIDSKVWITYDILGYLLPQDIINDYNVVGFKILTNNSEGLYGYPSITSFKDKSDITRIVYTLSNNNEYVLGTSTTIKRNINVYFDSGNQSISLMNDKLFREIKLSLGSLPNSLLDMDYAIDVYVDGKLVIPNQTNTCGHIHQVPVNRHYRGTQENVNGFQKVTFFAPARGRIPRVVFSLNCDSDINILEYAIVYMQLNAK